MGLSGSERTPELNIVSKVQFVSIIVLFGNIEEIHTILGHIQTT